MCSVRLGLSRREVKIAELDMDNNIRNFLCQRVLQGCEHDIVLDTQSRKPLVSLCS